MANFNFHREKNIFMDWLMMNRMSTGEIVLWHTLMNIGNRMGQKNQIDPPSSTLMSLTGLSKQGMYDARKKLEKRGMIRVKQGSRNQSPIYEMVPLKEALQIYTYGQALGQPFEKESENLPPNLTQNLTQNLAIYKEKEKEKRRGGDARELQSLFDMYEQNFGKLKPLIKKEFIRWVQIVGLEVVEEGVTLAVKKGGKTFSYVEKILKEWVTHGLKTIEEVRIYEKMKEEKHSIKPAHDHRINKTDKQRELLKWAREEFK